MATSFTFVAVHAYGIAAKPAPLALLHAPTKVGG